MVRFPYMFLNMFLTLIIMTSSVSVMASSTDDEMLMISSVKEMIRTIDEMNGDINKLGDNIPNYSLATYDPYQFDRFINNKLPSKAVSLAKESESSYSIEEMLQIVNYINNDSNRPGESIPQYSSLSYDPYQFERFI